MYRTRQHGNMNRLSSIERYGDTDRNRAVNELLTHESLLDFN